jgi:hypothetical protein
MSRASSIKAAVQLNTITHQLSVSHNTAERIEKHLQHISSQNSNTREIALRAANMASETKNAVLSTTRRTRKSWDAEEKQQLMIGSYDSRSVAAGPSTAFERSPNFSPAQYTISTRVSQVRVLAMFEKSCSSVQRVNEYHIIFSRSPQRWLSIMLSVSTQRKAAYWNPFKLRTSQTAPMRFLPKPLERNLSKVLSELDDSGDQVQLAIDFSEGGPDEKFNPTITPMTATPGKELLNFVRDLGCPVYPEKAISPLSNYGSPRGTHGIAAFVSGLPDGQLCREDKMLAQAISVEEAKWKLRLYRCLENSPYVPNLLGVVTDSSFHYVKSILTDTAGNMAPTPLIKLINNFTNNSNSQHVTLIRRLSWARQIITGLRDIHQKGFVVGILDMAVIGVDPRSQVQILSYHQKGSFSNLRYISTAPELRHLAHDAEIPFTSRTDLFQLGQLLWLIGQHQHSQPSLYRCGCMRIEGYDNCQHSAAINLPRMDRCIPDWYSKVVDVCRYENPEDRWTASELLSLFPSQDPSIPEDTLVFKESWEEVTYCDMCNIRIFLKYTCKVCHDGIFDLCSVCFNAGEHCVVDDHLLEELIHEEELLAWKPTGRHYSKPNQDSGQRNMLYLE